MKRDINMQLLNTLANALDSYEAGVLATEEERDEDEFLNLLLDILEARQWIDASAKETAL